MNISIKITRKENCAHYNVSAGAIVSIDLDKEYLPICISSEIYESDSRTPPEAKKAQAIAARSYALSFAAKKGVVMDDTTSYQAFSWKNLSKIPNCVKAVNDTAGVALVNNNKVITAWFASSNGGHTKRSDQAWSASTPWTVSQEDRWDAAGRIKWNVKEIMHCVGMSQTGAAYAASIGVTYEKILAFYYPNTELVANFGVKAASKGEEPMTEMKNTQDNSQNTNKVEQKDNRADQKTNIGLVEFAREWIGQPYWYGTYCNKCTQGLLTTKSKQYPSMYTANRMPRYQKDIAQGKSAADCVGLIKGYHWFNNGVVKYDKKTDVNATGLYRLAKIKGPIHTIPEIPGLVLYKPGHVGIYEGNGDVIEAKGFNYGIIRSKIENTKWTDWVVDPLISYEGYEELFEQNMPQLPYTAIVNTKTEPLNIWSTTTKAKSLLKIEKGDTLSVTGYASASGWYIAEKDGVKGFVDGQYLLTDNMVSAPPVAPKGK